MRQKKKKEAVETIAQKMVNDASGKIMGDLLRLAEVAYDEEKVQANSNSYCYEYAETLKDVDWLYGYEEDEIPEFMRSLNAKLEEMAFYKGSSYVKILTSIAGVWVLSSYNYILLQRADEENLKGWETKFEESDNQKISVCLEILKRYCPFEITVNEFLEARRYIKMWDSEFNW